MSNNHNFYVNTRFDGRAPQEGDRVEVTLPGSVVNFSDKSGDMWVDIDPVRVEHVDADTGRVLVHTHVRETSPGVPDIAAGQVWSRNGRTYMVYREKPLSQGGDLLVRDALTGMLVGTGSLIGAKLEYDPLGADNR